MRVLHVSGREQDAAQQESTAWEMAQEIGNLFQDPELRETFLSYAWGRIHGAKELAEAKIDASTAK